MSEPADGCTQCERIGCVYEEQKYEAGHSFHMDPCQVCHCPNDGGKFMCYPIPDCDPGKVHKPMLTATTEKNPPWRPQKHPLQNIFNTQGSKDSLTKPFPLSHSDSLPPFKLNPHGDHMDEEEEEEDYDYPTSESLEPSVHDPASPTEQSVISVSFPENVTPLQVFHKGTKQELKESFGFHAEVTDRPWFPLHKERTDDIKYNPNKDNPTKDAISISVEEAKFKIPEEADKEKLPIYREQFSIDRDISERQSFGLYKDNMSEETLEESNTDSEGLAAPTESTDSEMFDLYETVTYTESVTDSPGTVDQPAPQLETTETTTTGNIVSAGQNQLLTPESREHYVTLTEEDIAEDVMLRNVTASNSHAHGGMYDKNEENTISISDVQKSTPASVATSAKPSIEHRSKAEIFTIPPVRFSPTSQPPFSVKIDEEQSATKQSQSLFDFGEEATEEEREERENTLSSFPKAHEGE